MPPPFECSRKGSNWCPSSSKTPERGEDPDGARPGPSVQGTDAGGTILCPAQGRIRWPHDLFSGKQEGDGPSDVRGAGDPGPPASRKRLVATAFFGRKEKHGRFSKRRDQERCARTPDSFEKFGSFSDPKELPAGLKCDPSLKCDRKTSFQQGSQKLFLEFCKTLIS